MARSFPGDGSNFVIANPTGPLDIANTPLTISFWFFLNTTTSGFFVHKWTSNNGSFAVDNNGAHLRLRINATGEGVQGAATLTTGVWYHAVARKNGNSATAATVFLNGVQDGAAGSSTNPIPDTAFDVDVGGTAGWAPHTRMADLAFWNVALTDAEIAALAKGVSPRHVHPLNIVAHYPLWGVAAATEDDLSGNGQTLSQAGTVGVDDHAPVGPYVLL